MSGPDFHTPQRRAVRRPVRGRRRPIGSNLWLTPVMAVAFVAALATFQRFPAGSEAVPAPLAALFAAEGATTRDALSARFGFCLSRRGRDCVVYGCTFWVAGDEYSSPHTTTPP